MMVVIPRIKGSQRKVVNLYLFLLISVERISNPNRKVVVFDAGAHVMINVLIDKRLVETNPLLIVIVARTINHEKANSSIFKIVVTKNILM